MNSLHQLCAAKGSSEGEQEGAEDGTGGSQPSDRHTTASSVARERRVAPVRAQEGGRGERSQGFRCGSRFSCLVRRSHVAAPIHQCSIPGVTGLAVPPPPGSRALPVRGGPSNVGCTSVRCQIHSGRMYIVVFILRYFVLRYLSWICVGKSRFSYLGNRLHVILILYSVSRLLPDVPGRACRRLRLPLVELNVRSGLASSICRPQNYL